MLGGAPDPADVPGAARRAEELGFDLVTSGEHLFFHGPTPNAFLTLAAAAAVTERIRLVSTLTLLPLYPMALVAKLTYAIGEDPIVASNHDWFVAAALTVRDRIVRALLAWSISARPKSPA